MLKHFHLGRRANFPVIFLVAVVVLFGTAFAILKVLDVQTLAQNKNAVELLTGYTTNNVG